MDPPEPAPGPADLPPPERIQPVESCVLLGDSITAQGDFTPFFPAVTLYNLGISGDTIAGVTARMDQAAELSPDLLLILCGGLLGSVCGFVFAQAVSMNVFNSSIQFHWLLIPVTVLVSVLVTGLSCLLPVRSATDVDPALVLKGE